MTILCAKNVRCQRQQRWLFAPISFELAPGDLLHIRGANGSGKTSLLRALCGLRPPEQGGIAWRGQAIERAGADYLKALQYVGHANGLKDELSAFENLRFAALMQDRDPELAVISAALERMGMGGHLHRKLKTLSLGQRRRVALAALAIEPRRSLWILDEPLAALDAHGTRLLTGLLAQHLEQGGIAVVTTHQDLELPAAYIKSISLEDPALDSFARDARSTAATPCC